MPTVNLTPGSPTWTNTTGSEVVVADGSASATGPGLNGTGPAVTPGQGGASTDIHGSAGSGADPNASNAAAGSAHISGSEVSTGDHDISSGSTIDLVGGGGASTATAGGGSGDFLELIATDSLTATITVGAAGQDTTISIEGMSTAKAGKGGNASGGTPGSGGTQTADSDWNGWQPIGAPGNDGTGTVIDGGTGGAGGGWASSTGFTLQNGGNARARCDADYTYLDVDLDGLSGWTNILKCGQLDDVSGNVFSQHTGGNGDGPDALLGGGGGGHATSSSDGAPGIPFATAANSNGADGPNPGDGGDGAGGNATTGGSGKLGFAVFTYTPAAVPPNRSRTIAKTIQELILDEYDARMSRGAGTFSQATGSTRNYNIGQTLKRSGSKFIPAYDGTCDAVLLANLRDVPTATDRPNVPLLVGGPAAINQDEIEFVDGATAAERTDQIAALIAKGIRLIRRPKNINIAGA